MTRTALLLCLLLAAGCVTVDATLKADGSGTITYTYGREANTTVASEKARFASPHLTIESLTLGEKTVTLEAKFDDVTKLDTAEGVTLATPKPITGQVPNVPDLSFSVTLPGKVIAATPTATIAGTRVTWTIKAADYAHAPKTELSVRYAAS